jgi:hypothetical protein
VAGGSSGWQVAGYVFPTANRQPLPPVTGRVGTASRHSCHEVGLITLDQPRSPNGERKVGAWLRRALVCEEGTT